MCCGLHGHSMRMAVAVCTLLPVVFRQEGDRPRYSFRGRFAPDNMNVGLGFTGPVRLRPDLSTAATSDGSLLLRRWVAGLSWSVKEG